jgi:hypothetical protein
MSLSIREVHEHFQRAAVVRALAQTTCELVELRRRDRERQREHWAEFRRVLCHQDDDSSHHRRSSSFELGGDTRPCVFVLREERGAAE